MLSAVFFCPPCIFFLHIITVALKGIKAFQIVAEQVLELCRLHTVGLALLLELGEKVMSQGIT